MTPLSVVIITYNEERNLRRCLESVRDLATEILVVDSGSADHTVSIAREFHARVIDQPFLGYIEQKNFALDHATHEWVLSLDADEALSQPLIDSIHDLLPAPETIAYRMNRMAQYNGKWIRHGTWYPDAKVRLFNRKKARWGGVNPHDRIELPAGESPVPLRGDLLHYPFISTDEHLAQMNRYTSIQAEALYKKGKRSGWGKILFNPCIAFVSGYIFKAGFLDGAEGLLIARSVAFFTLVKYMKLKKLQETAATGVTNGGRES